jgi:predicted DNA binding protein
MATIVKGALPAEEFALRESLSALPDVEFEVEQIVESGADAVMPLLWVREADPAAISEALEADSSVSDPSLLVNVDGEQLYRMEWIEQVDVVLQMLTSSQATVTDAYGVGETWYLRVLYPDRASLSETIDYCTDNGLTFDIETIRELEGKPAGRYGLSASQYEALTEAAEQGYYEVPRAITLDELADELDTSHQALSERLRRGTLSLMEDTLLIGPQSEK